MQGTEYKNRLEMYPFTEAKPEERNHTEIKDSFNTQKSISLSLNINNGTMAHRYIREKRPFTMIELFILVTSVIAIWKIAASSINPGTLSTFSSFLR